MSQTTVDARECANTAHALKALSVEQARQRILASVEPVSGVEKLALRSALGRIIAEDVYSPINVPSHTNSAVDGYALAAVGMTATQSKFRVVGTSWAGKPYSGTVKPGECVRIMTGAALPSGTDTVLMQEFVSLENGYLIAPDRVPPGDNVRAAGEDLAKGQLALSKGKQIMPPELGLLASLGFAEVAVTRRVRVAFFSTGDELRSIGEPLAEGEIYDSNRYTLYGMLMRLGVELLDMGVIRDDRYAIEKAFLDAASNADVIITSGGVSVGDADYVKETLERLGEINFWQIAMKPGRPLAFGRIKGATFFGLPGNPVSVMVTFYQFVEQAIRHRMGQTNARPAGACFKVRCATRLHKRPGRAEFQRGILESDTNGELVVRATGQQGSGILRSMSAANCFVFLPRDSQSVEPGTYVDVQPFHGIL